MTSSEMNASKAGSSANNTTSTSDTTARPPTSTAPTTGSEASSGPHSKSPNDSNRPPHKHSNSDNVAARSTITPIPSSKSKTIDVPPSVPPRRSRSPAAASQPKPATSTPKAQVAAASSRPTKREESPPVQPANNPPRPNIQEDLTHQVERVDKLKAKMDKFSESLGSRKPFKRGDAIHSIAEKAGLQTEAESSHTARHTSPRAQAPAAKATPAAANADSHSPPRKPTDTTRAPSRTATTQQPRNTASPPRADEASPRTQAPSRAEQTATKIKRVPDAAQSSTAQAPPQTGAVPKRPKATEAAMSSAQTSTNRARTPQPATAGSAKPQSGPTVTARSGAKSSTSSPQAIIQPTSAGKQIPRSAQVTEVTASSTQVPEVKARHDVHANTTRSTSTPAKSMAATAEAPVPTATAKPASATETRTKRAHVPTPAAGPSGQAAPKADTAAPAPSKASASLTERMDTLLGKKPRVQSASDQTQAEQPPHAPLWPTRDVDLGTVSPFSSPEPRKAPDLPPTSEPAPFENPHVVASTPEPSKKRRPPPPPPSRSQEHPKTTGTKPPKALETAKSLSPFMTHSVLEEAAPLTADVPQAAKDRAASLRIDSWRANEDSSDASTHSATTVTPRTPQGFRDDRSHLSVLESPKRSPQIRRIRESLPITEDMSTDSASVYSTSSYSVPSQSAHHTKRASNQSHHTAGSSSSSSRSHSTTAAHQEARPTQLTRAGSSSSTSTRSEASTERRHGPRSSTPQPGSPSSARTTSRATSYQNDLGDELSEKSRSSRAATPTPPPTPRPSHHTTAAQNEGSKTTSCKTEATVPMEKKASQSTITQSQAAPRSSPKERPTESKASSSTASRPVSAANTEASSRTGKDSSSNGPHPSAADAACAASGAPMQEVARHHARMSKAETIVSEVGSIDYIPPPLPPMPKTLLSPPSKVPSSSKGKERAADVGAKRPSAAFWDDGVLAAEAARHDVSSQPAVLSAVDTNLNSAAAADTVSLRSGSPLISAFRNAIYWDEESEDEYDDEDDDLVYHSQPAYLSPRRASIPMPRQQSRTSSVIAVENLAKLDSSLARLQQFAPKAPAPQPLRSAMKGRTEVASCRLGDGEPFALVDVSDAAGYDPSVAGSSRDAATRLKVHFPSGSLSSLSTPQDTPIETVAGDSLSRAPAPSAETRISRGIEVPVDFPPRYSDLSLVPGTAGSASSSNAPRPGRERSQSDVTEHRQSQLRHARSVPFLLRSSDKLREYKENRKPGGIYANSLHSRSKASLGTQASGLRQRIALLEEREAEPSGVSGLWRRAKKSLGLNKKKEPNPIPIHDLLSPDPFRSVPLPLRPRPAPPSIMPEGKPSWLRDL